VWFDNAGTIGSGNDVHSSFGAVAEGDVVLDQTRACSVTIRGAFLAMSGMLSHHPNWRGPFKVDAPPNGWCAGTATLQGSMTGHYGPALYSSPNGTGYATRRYQWLPSLYNNPPPMYPTASDWETTRLEPANLDCFDQASGALKATQENCG
jgi:hypothetical protein